MIGKLDAWVLYLRELMYANAEVYLIVLLMFAILGAVLMRFIPDQSERFKGWVRMARYCHSCPHADLYSESCAIDAKSGEKCGLIDMTAGMKFEVTKVS